MAIANYFYNATTKKYIALFGSIFNKISIARNSIGTGEEIQRMVVPISYGPYQKFLARVNQDPDLNRKTAISLPRMSFEMTKFEYDGSRKINSIKKIKSSNITDSNSANFQYSPAPYDIEFSLYIMTSNAEDGTQILEQIIPFFKPEWTTTVKLMDNLEPIDIPLVLQTVDIQDLYENKFETRRALLLILTFKMKCWYFGPDRQKKVIKFIDTKFYSNLDKNSNIVSTLNIQPGLTPEGLPTAILSETIPYTEIQEDDDWGIIITITEDY
jgi:hypothetical protein